jgi:hypothetical protein
MSAFSRKLKGEKYDVNISSDTSQRAFRIEAFIWNEQSSLHSSGIKMSAQNQFDKILCISVATNRSFLSV